MTCKRYLTGWLCDVECADPKHDEFLEPKSIREENNL